MAKGETTAGTTDGFPEITAESCYRSEYTSQGSAVKTTTIARRSLGPGLHHITQRVCSKQVKEKCLRPAGLGLEIAVVGMKDERRPNGVTRSWRVQGRVVRERGFGESFGKGSKVEPMDSTVLLLIGGSLLMFVASMSAMRPHRQRGF
jgi:hypothetical protein